MMEVLTFMFERKRTMRSLHPGSFFSPPQWSPPTCQIGTQQSWQDEVANLISFNFQTSSKASSQPPLCPEQSHLPRWSRPRSRCRAPTRQQSTPPRGLQKPQPAENNVLIKSNSGFKGQLYKFTSNQIILENSLDRCDWLLFHKVNTLTPRWGASDA